MVAVKSRGGESATLVVPARMCSARQGQGELRANLDVVSRLKAEERPPDGGLSTSRAYVNSTHPFELLGSSELG